MERKTEVHAENGKHDLVITREFDLPIELLWRAHSEAEIVEEWMSHDYSQLRFVNMDFKRHRGWEFERRDPQGDVHLRAHGVFHAIVHEQRIVRTFELLDAPFGVQMEVYEFVSLGVDASLLRLHIVYESVDCRDQMLQKGMVTGLGMAHNRLQEIIGQKR